MLAKQVWRLVKIPNSLVARVLRGRYYPTSNLLQDDISASGSYVWKSLLWGRELLSAGSRWRVGTRSSLLIYADKWIPKPFSFKVQSVPVLGVSAMVKSLISDSGRWNSSLIRDSFLPEEADAILSLPLGSSNLKDSLLWHYEKSGVYTVRSGYRLGRMILDKDHPSSSSIDEWWKFFWKLGIPQKIKIFVWKACRNWLPTMGNLAERGLQVDINCPVCHASKETSMHALWGCFCVKSTRKACYFLKNFRWTDDMQLLDMLAYCKCTLRKEEIELLCVVLWRIWFWRNQSVQLGHGCRLENILEWAADYIDEFRSANLGKKTDNESDRNTADFCWTKPSHGVFKINTDAAIREANKMVGVGAVIRDSSGAVLCTAVHRFDACYDASIAEAAAILFGLRMAVDRGLLPAVLESDAKGVVDLINSGAGSSADIGVVLSDILLLASCFHIPISFIPRKANGVAHTLASFAFKSSVDFWWGDSCPPCLESVVRGDCLV